MSRKDVIIEKQQEQIEELNEQVKAYMNKNHALMNALVETEKRLKQCEENTFNAEISDFTQREYMDQ